MTERTPYRKYDKRTKLAVVMAADMVGVVQASEQSGIPHSTISSWVDRPEFAEIRRKTREDLASEIKTVAHLAWQRIAETIKEMEPRDALFAADKASTLMLLMSGEATSRTESRSLMDDLNDHETEVLSDVIRGELARRSDQHLAELAVEGAASAGADTAAG